MGMPLHRLFISTLCPDVEVSREHVSCRSILCSWSRHEGRRLSRRSTCVPRRGGTGATLADVLRDSGLILAVVERELVGGECPQGCVPSKTLLRSGETSTTRGPTGRSQARLRP